MPNVKKSPQKSTASHRPSKSDSKSKPPTPATSLSPAEAYARHVQAARALPDAQVMSCRGEVALVLHNVRLGVLAVQAHEERIKKELPAIPLAELWLLPEIATALVYATDQINGPATKTEIAQKLARLRQIREPMLLIAEGLALYGLLPGERVAAIRAGSGAIDTARDGIALEALYRDHAAALRNKHPFSEAELKEATELGGFLLRSVTPAGGRQPNAAKSEAETLRDRFYTLVVARHALLRKAGFYLFGEAVDEKVPLLQARASRSAKSEPAPAPAPQPS